MIVPILLLVCIVLIGGGPVFSHMRHYDGPKPTTKAQDKVLEHRAAMLVKEREALSALRQQQKG